MSGGAEARELEERLREAAALGDAEEVRRLLGAGADINSRNEINGWTCLHWACKRNHARVVSCLLDAGADKHILTAQGELPAQLTSKPDIRKILEVEEETECQGAEGLNLPVAASPLARPPLPSVSAAEGVPDSAAESPSDSASTSSASERDASPCGRTPTAWCGEEDPPALGAAEPPPAAGAAPRPIGSPESPRGPGAPPGPARRPPEPAAPEPAAPLRPEGSPAGPAPGFQPFFFTGTFPCNMQELVLKVRVQNLRDNDFIEIELDRQELTYQDLLRVSCCELGVNPDQVEKIRKLPNTLVRKDKDVARLQDFQELELVLAHSDRSPFRGARPCSGSRAAELTY